MTRSKGIIIGIAFIVVVIVLLGWWGKTAADGAAQSYTDQFAAWQKRDVPKLVALSSLKLNKTLFPGDISNQQQISDQKTQCDSISADGAKIETSYKVPSLSPTVFSFLSHRYGEAQKVAEARAGTVNAYRQAAANVYKQIAADCTFSNIVNRAVYTNQYFEAQKKMKGLIVPYGAIWKDGQRCGAQQGCLAPGNANRKLYVKYYSAIHMHAFSASVAQLDKCDHYHVSFAAACPAYAAVFKAYTKNTQPWLDALSKGSSTKIQAAEQKMKKSNSKAFKTYLAQMKKALPSIASKINTSTDNSDTISMMLDNHGLRQLSQSADSIKNLN